jgi:NitT/TauT family transport system ATP-binding protein
VVVRDPRDAYRTRTGRHLALDGADLSIGHGEFVALVGPSGYGKSTLLEVVAGLAERSGGEALIDGEPIDGTPHLSRGRDALP